MEEIMQIRDYLAKPAYRNKALGKENANDKADIIDIPELKVFERAMLLPSEIQCHP